MDDPVPPRASTTHSHLRAAPPAMQMLFVMGVLAWVGLVWLLLQLAFPGWPYRWDKLWAPFAGLAYCLPVALFLERRYGVTLTRLRNRDRPGAATPRRRRSRAGWWIFGYFLGALAGLAAVVAGAYTGIVFTAAHGGGVSGALYGVERDCPTCEWRGTFHSDDGSVNIAFVTLVDAVPGIQPAGIVPVRYSPTTEDAYAWTGSDAWVAPAVATAISGGYALGVLIWLTIGEVRVLRSGAAPVIRPRPMPAIWPRAKQ